MQERAPALVRETVAAESPLSRAATPGGSAAAGRLDRVIGDPMRARAADVMRLHRTVGNQIVQQMCLACPTSPARAPEPGLAGRALRPLPGGATTRPLSVGSGVAARLARPAIDAGSETVPASVASTVGAFGADLLRVGLTASKPQPSLARRADSALASLGPGAPLPASVRAPFEQSFGYDLSPVRVHSGSAAARAAQAANALAFALGDHVVLGTNLDSSSALGQRVLGHELAHTIQARRGGFGGGGRISDPSWPSEREADRAVDAALAGRRFDIVEPGGDNLQRIAPWLILAGIGLVAGLVGWALSDSPEENARRHAAGDPDASREVWALVPIYGSIQQIREAESYFQRVLGVGFLMLDFATLGSAGIAARALIRAPGALIRAAIARRGAALAVREGGEIVSELAAREATAAFTREGGVLVASRQLAASEMMQALQRGSFVVVTEGTLNHAVIYARNAAGQILKIHGGPLKVLMEEAPRALTPGVASGIAQRVNAYVVIEAGQAAGTIEQAVAGVQRSGPAILRWLGGNPTSCGIVQGAVLEATGLPAATLARLVPAGGAAARMLPITVFDHIMASGGVRLVEGGLSRIIGGTLLQGATLAFGALVPTVTAGLLRFVVNEAFLNEPPTQWSQATSRPPAGGILANFLGRMILRARAQVDPANWDSSGLRVRSRAHLAVIGGSMLLAQTPDAFLAAVGRPLSSFSLGPILGELAEDVNAALLARGGVAGILATYTAEFIGRQSALSLFDLLAQSGALRYYESLDAIVDQQMAVR